MWLHQTVRRAKSFHVCEATSTLVTERATTWDAHTPHHKKFPFTPGMHIMTEFFVELFASLPDLIVPVGDSDEGHVLVYTDASDSPDHSGMGIVIIDTKTNRKFISECIVPPEFLNLLRRDRDAIINHPELLAIECAFLTFGDIVRGRKVLFFGDNTSSLSAVVHGYSASPELGRLSNATQLSMAALQCDVFFAYVPTDANIADIPSRARGARSVSDLKLILNLGDTSHSENKLESRAIILPHVKVLTLDGMRKPIETPQRVV